MVLPKLKSSAESCRHSNSIYTWFEQRNWTIKISVSDQKHTQKEKGLILKSEYKVDTARRFESRGQSGSVLTKGYRRYNKLCYRVHLLTNLLLRSREERDEIRRQTNKLPSSIILPPEERNVAFWTARCCWRSDKNWKRLDSLYMARDLENERNLPTPSTYKLKLP